MQSQEKTAHFGFKNVDFGAKTGLVREVFASVAGRYDLMNDLMSAGLHRWWKDQFVRRIGVPKSAAILDLAGGTGDIAMRLHAQTGATVAICDINEEMLNVGRDRQIDAGKSAGLRWICGNAEALPVPDQSLDVITIAFGLRNVTDIPKALAEASRALKPGGQFLCLEFSQVVVPLLARLYDSYSFHLIPWIGELVASDRASYQYLVESIRMFPKQEALKTMMEQAGLRDVTYENLTFGVVAIHRGWK